MELLPVEADSDCPSAAEVQAEVRELTTPEQRAGVPRDAKVMVSDRGESVAIAITRDGKTTVRVYRDAARDCARRAHFVSVLAVVALMPPDIAAPEPEPEPAPPAPALPPRTSSKPEPEPEPKPEPSARAPRRVRIELGARGEVGAPLGDSVRAALVGGAFGVALGAGALRLTLGSSYAPRTELQYTGEVAGRARLQRLDFSAGVRWLVTHAPVDASLDAGLLASRAEVTGLSSKRPARDTAFSLGARLGVQVCWSEQSVLSPFIGASANVFPSAPELAQLPQGTVGHLPYLWLGLSAGLSLAL